MVHAIADQHRIVLPDHLAEVAAGRKVVIEAAIRHLDICSMEGLVRRYFKIRALNSMRPAKSQPSGLKRRKNR